MLGVCTYPVYGCRMTSLTNAHLAEVANVYAMSPSAPTKAVALYFGVPGRTASHWVMKAREQGLLSAERVTPRNWKVAAVANELGVEYDDLMAALARVGGDLRVAREMAAERDREVATTDHGN